MSQTIPQDALVVGGDVAGLTAATFLARVDLDILVVNDDEPIIRRNAHLENTPDFLAGVNSRLFTGPLPEQVDRNDAGRLTGRVIDLDVLGDDEDPLFRTTAETDDSGETIGVFRIVAVSWSGASYLEDTGVDLRIAGLRTYVGVDDLGQTDVPGIHATGRLTEIYHQAAVAADDVVETAITLVHDSRTAFYNDWAVSTGYFTDHGHEVLSACGEVDTDEHAHREYEPHKVMHEFFTESHDKPQRTHPSLVDDEFRRLDE